MADCRTSAQKEHAGSCVCTPKLGSGGNAARDTSRRLGQSKREQAVRGGERGSVMKIDIFPDAESVAHEAAKLIAEAARTAVSARGKFTMALSGGKTPWIMLRNLAQEDVPWGAVHVVQVDERIAP